MCSQAQTPSLDGRTTPALFMVRLTQLISPSECRSRPHLIEGAASLLPNWSVGQSEVSTRVPVVESVPPVPLTTQLRALVCLPGSPEKPSSSAVPES